MKRSIWFLKLLCIVFLLCWVAGLTGCATIIKGPDQEMTFKSEPEGATVIVNGRPLGKTPITTKIDRKSGQVLSFEKEGYKTEVLPLETTMNPWVAGNILIGGFFGTTTDAISGSIHEYSPSFYNVTLRTPSEAAKFQESRKSDTKSFIIVNYKNLFEELHSTSGQYVASLMSLLKVADDKKEEVKQILKELSDKFKDIPEYADKVVAEFIK